MGQSDPIEQLTHDHGHLSALVQAAAALLVRMERVEEMSEEASDEPELAAGTGVGYALCVSTYDRFVEVYAAHAQSEQTLLRAVDAALDADARAALRALLQAI